MCGYLELYRDTRDQQMDHDGTMEVKVSSQEVADLLQTARESVQGELLDRLVLRQTPLATAASAGEAQTTVIDEPSV